VETVKRKENGFLTVDLGVAMLVITIFVTIMTSYLYSLYITSTEAKKTAIALNYSVEIFEYIGKVPYANVTANNVLSNMTFVTELGGGNTEGQATAKIGTGASAYDVSLTVAPQYTDNKIKLITLKITYKTSKKNTQTIELKRLKTV